jgi:hypothetical protein
LYSACSAAALAAYAAFIALVLLAPHGHARGAPHTPAPAGSASALLLDIVFTALTYSVYFGVLVRDTAEIAAENVSAALGYYKKDDDDGAAAEPPPGMCALCGVYLPGWEATGGGGTANRVGGGGGGGGGSGDPCSRAPIFCYPPVL